MNIVERLKDLVVENAFGQTPPTQQEHNAIHDYISLFLAQLASRKDLSDLKTAHSSQDLIAKLFPDNQNRENLFRKLAEEHKLDNTRLGEIIHRVTPEAALGLERLAQQDNRSVPEFLRHNMTDVGTKLPRWALALLPAGALAALGLKDNAGAGTTAAQRQAAENNTGKRPINEPAQPKKKNPWPWIILIIIILALILWWLFGRNTDDTQKAPEAQQTTAPADQAPAQETRADEAPAEDAEPLSLTLKTDSDAKVSNCDAKVNGEDLQKAITDSAQNAECDIQVDNKIAPSKADPAELSQLLAFIAKTPDASLELDDNKATIDVKDEAQAQEARKLATEALVGYEVEVNGQDGDEVAAADDNADVAPALADTDADTDTAADADADEVGSKDVSEVVLGEDGKVQFFFATNQTSVPANSEDKVKEIVAAAADGKTIAITGYTDSTGTLEVNQKVSEERASSVKAFLIRAGVPEDKIELVKPDETVAAEGKNQRGRRVDVYIKE